MKTLLAIAITLAITAPARAQSDYPTRTVRIIIGFGAGAAADTPGRLLAQKFTAALGQQFVVENRPGAGSNIAAEHVARAPKDGHTLFMGTAANTQNVSISPNLTFDFAKDFAPIALVAAVPNILVAHPTLGVEKVADLVALAKQKPGEIMFGSSGVGTSTHLAGELLNVMAGIKLVHVPYPGSAQAITDVLTGRIPLLFAPASAVIQHVEKGNLKALASTQLKRAGIAPAVPTMSEAGLPGFQAVSWIGLMGPAGMPKDIVERLSSEMVKIMAEPAFRQRLLDAGAEPVGSSAAEFAAHMKAEIERWEPVVKAAGLYRMN